MYNIRLMSCSVRMRLKRLVAAWIDWLIIWLCAIVIAAAVFALVNTTGNSLFGLVLFPVILGAFALFILRDAVLKKGSIGKRIMGFKIVDKYTGGDATRKQKASRGISFLIVGVDILFLLFSGSSLGDRIGSTAVVKKTFTMPACDLPFEYGQVVDEDGDIVKKPSNKKVVVLFIVAAIVFVLSLAAIVVVAFTKIKTSEEYRLAYDYLVSSEYFEYYGLSEDDITFMGYKGSEYVKDDIKYAEVSFKVGGKHVTVYCVRENGTWYVSEEDSRLNTPSLAK